MKIPYVIDNQTHHLANILNDLPAEHRGRSLDVATAYFTRFRFTVSFWKGDRLPPWRCPADRQLGVPRPY